MKVLSDLASETQTVLMRGGMRLQARPGKQLPARRWEKRDGFDKVEIVLHLYYILLAKENVLFCGVKCGEGVGLRMECEL